MKKRYTIITILAIIVYSNSFSQGKQELTEAAAKAKTADPETKGINFGISLGFNYAFEKLYDARISPIDTTLVLEKVSPVSFVLSTTLSFPITKKLGGRYYVALDKDGKAVGDAYFVPSGLCVVATINLVTFNSALGGAGLFNQKLDGGLGLGYTFGENVQVAFTCEMLSFLQPRSYITKLEGKKIVVNKQVLTSLPTDNNDYYINKYRPSLSFKIIYILNKK